jgi:hypothetical protein
MKKTILLVLLLLCAPAMAAVNITCTATGNVVSINYDASAEPNLVRGFALNVTATGANITGISDVHPKYYIYPGTIQIDANGDVTNWGTPVAPASAPDNPGQLGTGSIVLEMGSLYKSGDDSNAPGATGLLCKLTVDGYCTIGIAGNSTRGNVVLENGNAATINATGCTVGQPCWNYDCFTCGDADGNCEVASADVLLLLSAWPPAAYNACADFDMNGEVSSADVLIQLAHWPPATACPSAEGCGPCTPI